MNREERKIYNKKWREQNPNYYREHIRKYRLKHPEYVKEHNRKKREEYYPKNKDKLLAKQKQWIKENPEMKKYYQYKYISEVSRKREFSLTRQEFTEILRGRCHYCGVIEKIGIDRVDNEKGYIKDNVVPCCSKCNYMKFTMTKEDFLKQCKKIVEWFEDYSKGKTSLKKLEFAEKTG